MRIDKDQNGVPQLTVSASDLFGPAVARHLAMLLEIGGQSAGDVAKARHIAGRMEAWRAEQISKGVAGVTSAFVTTFADDPEPEPQPAVEPQPTPPEPEPEPVELPVAASSGKRSRRACA